MAKKQPDEPITANAEFVTAEAILSRLNAGATQLEAEIGALRIEVHLGRGRPDVREGALRARLQAHRRLKPAPEETLPSSGVSVTITAALELLGSGVRVPRKADRQQIIVALLEDLETVRAAAREQKAIRDELFNELTGANALRRKPNHTELAKQELNAYREAARKTDALREFHVGIAKAGFGARPDILQETTLRAGLVLGSESNPNSDISRAVRRAEELGWL
jgi:hypothetical protein